MINGLEGIPGSGKSYEACVFQVLEAVKQGRKVITNLPLSLESYGAIDPSYRALIEIRYAPGQVRGTWDPYRVDEVTGAGEAFQLFPDGRIEPPPEGSRVFGTVWCFWSDWRHPKTGQGPLFVVDECHVAMPKLGTDKALVEWFKLHRHFGCDVLLATQRFRQTCADIADLMAMVIKVRKADILGRSDKYIRKVHAGYRGAVIQESIRTYEPAFFALYRSHTQGSSVLESQATDVSSISVKIRKWTRLSWLLFGVAAIWAAWVALSPKKPTPPTTPTRWVKPDGYTDMDQIKRDTAKAPESAKPADPLPTPPVEAKKPAEVAPDPNPEPYEGKTLHLTGMMKMAGRVLYTFAVTTGSQSVVQVTSDDLSSAGYRWQPLGDCAGYLRFGNTTRPLICDSPYKGNGSSERPVVINTADGPKSQGNPVAPSPSASVSM